MTTDTDFAALCAAIDQGDDSCLPILADWLEERGDPRTAGMRTLIAAGYRCDGLTKADGTSTGDWYIDDFTASGREVAESHRRRSLPRDVWVRLPLPADSDGRRCSPEIYQTRSAAYLALAEALRLSRPCARCGGEGECPNAGRVCA